MRGVSHNDSDQLLGIGISVTVKTSRGGRPLIVSPQSTMKVSGGFLIVSILSSLIFIPYNGFGAGRRFGIYLLTLYSAFMVTVILVDILGG